MPIRFRCVYCNQLLGISRRKAGAVVRCTSCQGQLIVPDPSPSATELANDDSGPAPALQGKSANGGLFERDDFDALLEPFQPQSVAAVAPPPSPASEPKTASPRSAPATASSPALLISLSRKQLTIAVASCILALGLVFAAGLWIGLAMH